MKKKIYLCDTVEDTQHPEVSGTMHQYSGVFEDTRRGRKGKGKMRLNICSLNIAKNQTSNV